MAYNTIQIQGDHDGRMERVANAAITPGHLVELMSTNKFRVHASAGQPVVPVIVAVEDDLQGNPITTAYAAASRVQANVQHPGYVFYGLLANGQDSPIGSKLESAGDGTLRVYAASSAGAVEYPMSIVGIALDDVDMSGSSGADPSTARIRVLVR
jgi:hypothetical protein